MNFRAFIAAMLIASTAVAQATPTIAIPQLELKYEPAPLVAVPPGVNVLTPLRLKEPAPDNGIFISVETSVRMTHFIEQAKLRLKEDVVLERKNCNANLTYIGKRAQLEQGLRLSLDADYRARILKLENTNIQLQNIINNPGIFQSPVFWLITGVVGSALLFGLSAYAMH